MRTKSTAIRGTFTLDNLCNKVVEGEYQTIGVFS
jgi:hypothetical protein